MTPEGSFPDRYRAWVTPDQPGAWTFEIQAWSDPLGDLAARRRHQDPGRGRRRADVHRGPAAAAARARSARAARTSRPGPWSGPGVEAAKDRKRPIEARLAALQDSEPAARCWPARPLRELVTVEGPFPAYADRQRALYGSWYEFFPRSEGATVDPETGVVTSGTCGTAAERLDAVAAMGFDVIYLPPIHPIGEVNRKGPNNTLTPGPDDPGSPWAIGSRHGGHDAIHPDLGTFDDFDAFVARAGELGLEVALDLALQAAPDHPWVTSHPEWFTTRADGTIAYAENPPKKYQDIYPINFDNDPEGICAGGAAHRPALDVARGADLPGRQPAHQAAAVLGVAARRDPRQRPGRGLPVRGVHPPGDDARAGRGRLPPVLHLLHLAQRQVGDRGLPPRAGHRVRPPDAAQLLRQHPRHPARLPAVRRPGRRSRSAPRSPPPASPSWGVYAGYELFEHVAVRPGSEEYLDSEKYQIRVRDWDAAEADRALAWRRTSPGSTRSGAHTPPCSCCAT